MHASHSITGELDSSTTLRVLCVARHKYLCEHVARFFNDLGLETLSAAGLDAAVVSARDFAPEVVVCDYDLLATIALETWESDELLSRIPVIAISLTRRPDEVHLLDVNGIAGFLYLPTLEPAVAFRILNAAAARNAIRLNTPALSVSALVTNPPQSRIS